MKSLRFNGVKKLLYLLLPLWALLAPAALAQLSVGSTATLYVGTGATLSVNGNVQNSGTLTNAGHVYLRGNLTNTNSLTSTDGNLTLDGSTAQTLTSSSALSVKNLTLNNTASGDAVTLATPLTVGGVGTFTDGILKTDATNKLVFADGATATGASAASHAKGPVQKTGDDAFVFPLGNGTAYRPASVAPQSGASTDAFTAEYKESDPGNTTSKAACLATVSNLESWQIDRPAGSAAAVVGLAYQNVATTVGETGALRVVRYAGSQWEALTCAANGGLADGRVLTNGATSNFGAFTLGSFAALTLSSGGQTSVSCKGGSNGSATVSVSGGTGPYTYAWSPSGGARATASGLGAGTYTVTVTDANGTEKTLPFTLTEPAAPSLTAGGPTTFCAGGSVLLSVGTFSSYVWKKDGQSVGTEATYSATASGSYTVTVTDGSGCTTTSAATTVTVNALPTVSLTGLAASYCPNAPAVTLAGTPSGGTFKVDGTAATQFNPATVGTGSHTVEYAYTDGNGCPATASQSVSVEALAFSGTPTVAGVPACSGQPITVTFAFNCPSGAQFEVKLSSKTGDFASATTLTGTLSGNALTVTLPNGTEPGTGYRVRVAVAGTNLASAQSEAFALNTGPGAGVATAASVCQGLPLPVTFSAGVCAPAGAVYAAQLSNAFGSFSNPTSLGSVTPGTANVPLPSGLAAGSGYRVRVLGGAAPVTSAPFELKAPSLSVTPSVGNAPVCRGSAITVGFSLATGSCPFPENNVFTAQLSSATGSFSNPTNLGAVVPGGTNNVTIPAGVAAGTGYRIRLVSSSPALTSASSALFQVKACNGRMSAEVAELVVLPNPVQGGEIRCRVSGMDSPQFSLTTVTGRSLNLSVKTDGSGEWVLTPRQWLAPGVYVLQATGGNARLTQRVLVAE